MEQLEAFDVQAVNAEVCCGGDAGSEDAPCSENAPCKPCGFIFFDGATRISQLSLGVLLDDFGSAIDKFWSTNSLGPATDPDSPPPDANAAKECLRALCEELALTGHPVRGPTAV